MQTLIQKIKKQCEEKNLKIDLTACEVLEIIEENQLSCDNCKKVEDEIKNTVSMERLLKQVMQDFTIEHLKVVKCKEFFDYLKELCSLRMTFDNPNEDLKSCLKFIDNTFDDLLIRIKDLNI